MGHSEADVCILARGAPDKLLNGADELPYQGQLQPHRPEGEDVQGDTTGKLVLHLYQEKEYGI